MITIPLMHCRGRREPARCIQNCGRVATLLCDYPIQNEPGVYKTCDRPLCASCAYEVGPDRHYCRVHWEYHLQREESAHGGVRVRDEGRG